MEEDFYFTFNPILHDAAAHLRALDLPPEEIDAILGGTTAGLLGL